MIFKTTYALLMPYNMRFQTRKKLRRKKVHPMFLLHVQPENNAVIISDGARANFHLMGSDDKERKVIFLSNMHYSVSL